MTTMALEQEQMTDPKPRQKPVRAAALASIMFTVGTALSACGTTKPAAEDTPPSATAAPQAQQESSAAEVAEGQRIFRFETFGDEQPLWQHPPYFHDGSPASLAAVVAHYNRVRKLSLTAEQQRDLVEYLKSL